jgi:hypothetical protein
VKYILEAPGCRYTSTIEGNETEHRVLELSNYRIELFEEPTYSILNLVHKGANLEHYHVVGQFWGGKTPSFQHPNESALFGRKPPRRHHTWEIVIDHPEAQQWVEMLQGFQGVLHFPLEGVRPYQQRAYDTHWAYTVEAEGELLRLVPDHRVPFRDHIACKDDDGLYGLSREIVRDTRLYTATVKDKENEWVAGLFRVWDGRYMGNNDIGIGETEEEALAKLEAHVRERLDSRSRQHGFSEGTRAVFAELARTWTLPTPVRAWPQR